MSPKFCQSTSSATVRKTKILLAEDNRVNQQIATLMLSKVGYVVDTAGNGIEVLEALERQAYQIILMDIEMPEMDGLTTTRRIHELYPPNQRPHIIALTASAMQGDRERFLSAGMQDYLAKPFEKTALLKVLLKAEEAIEAALQEQSAHTGADKADSASSSVAVDVDVILDDTLPSLNHQTIERIQEMLGAGSLKILEEVINTYFTEAPECIANIFEEMDKGNDLEMARAAHKLRSSSANLGLERLSSLCETLEKHGRGHIRITPSDYKPHLEAEYEAAKTELMTMLCEKQVTPANT